MNVLVAGEGTTELGRWAIEPMHRDERHVGVLEALVAQRGGRVVDGVVWKNIRKFRAGDHRAAETRTVLGLALEAKERGLVLVFLRDRDSDARRQADLDAGIAEATRLFSTRIAGGCAVESVEALGLWALGDVRAETHTDPKAVLRSRGHEGTAALVALLTEEALERAAPGSHAARWLADLRSALAP